MLIYNGDVFIETKRWFQEKCNKAEDKHIEILNYILHTKEINKK